MYFIRMTSAASKLKPTPEERATVRLSLELSPQLNETLEELAERIHGSKSDVLRKAIAIMEVAVRAKEEGKKFGIAERDQTLSTEVVGV
jgi:predicted transcriptional regulator